MRMVILAALGATMVLAGCDSFRSHDTVRVIHPDDAYAAEGSYATALPPHRGGCTEGFSAIQAGTRICVGY